MDYKSRFELFLKKLTLYLKIQKNQKIPKILSCIPYFKCAKYALKYICYTVENKAFILRLITFYSKKGHHRITFLLVYKLFCSITSNNFTDICYFLTNKSCINFTRELNQSYLIKGIIIPFYLKTKLSTKKCISTKYLVHSITKKPSTFVSLLVYLLMHEFGSSYSYLTRILLLKLCDMIPKYLILHIRWYIKKNILINKSSDLLLRKIIKRI
ncbi:hypothetical protein BNATCHR377 (nucleomorph) [Bigelowiella natans]|uniref:Uncharacterized protein n=1 Tax=Bigelowiella natans TaxID=227086 RepID=Q3LVW7_BIGNA|nr:hypothetical protein BNATCHR377 [Bigelowiella natans]ABA27398.1 hypothetical protein [Bigelowiella natans]